MVGLDFTIFTGVFQLWVNEIASMLKLVNWTLLFSGLVLMKVIKEKAKLSLGEDIGTWYTDFLGIVICILLALIHAFDCGVTLSERIVTGIVTGGFVIGGWKIFIDMVSSIFDAVFRFVLKLKSDTGGDIQAPAVQVVPSVLTTATTDGNTNTSIQDK